jgi:NADH-quinone oxidoreductase subunit N
MFKAFLPEIFLSLSILSLLLFDSHLVNTLKFHFPLLENEILFQCKIIIFFVFLLCWNNSLEGIDSSLLFIWDKSSIFIKLLFLSIIFFSFIIIWRSFLLQRLNLIEYFILFLCAILSSLFLINSFNFLSLYLCLELQSLCFYILSAYHRTSIFSGEAGLKYFTTSSVISGIFLLGCLIFYGVLGVSNFLDINIVLSLYSFEYENTFVILLWGSLFIISTLLFKLTIAPYHLWFPQIYDGSPLSSTIIFNIIPKLIIFSIFLRFWSVLGPLTVVLKGFLLLVGLYSICFGIFEALKQRRIKKLFIYSSISQMGLPLCALCEGTLNSFSALIFFLIIYLFTSILMWGFFVLFVTNQKLQTSFWLDKINIYSVFISILSDVKKFNFSYALLLIFIFFSLGAIPPFVGFLNKIYIYLAVIESSHYEVAIFLAYVGAFGVYYYIKVLKIAFFEQELLNKKNKQQTFFDLKFLNIDMVLFSVLMFFLLFLCFYPNIVLLFSKIIVIENEFIKMF